VKVSDLSAGALRQATRDGLTLSTPPFITRIQTPITTLQHNIGHMYGEYDVVGPEEVPDFLVRVEGTGGVRRFVGKQCMAHIDVTTPFIPLPESLSPLMLEQALNWSVAVRTGTYLVFHAAIVAKEGRALLIPGASGQGKSTLCASLVASGWQLYSDELTLLDVKTGMAQAHPRPISLKNESIKAMQDFAPDWPFSGSYGGTPKGTIAYMLPRRADIEAAGQPAKPVAILTPLFQKGVEPRLEPTTNSNAFLQLIISSINYSNFGEEGFSFLSNLVNEVPMATAHYGDVAAGVALAEEMMAI
jgi:HprK-related kinase A